MSLNVPLREDVMRARLPEHAANGSSRLPIRALLLTNCIAPYSVAMLRHLTQAVESFQVLVSTPMEQDRHWQPEWDGLNVMVQRSFTFTHQRVFRQGYRMTFFRHFPYDTLARLRRLRPDVVISAQLGFRTMQAVAYRRMNPESRLVLWVDGSEHTEREIGLVRTKFRRGLLRHADAVLVNGASGQKYVERLGVGAARIVQAPYTTHMAQFLELPLMRSGDAATRLLYVGQLVESKGLINFLRALARWGERNPSQRRELWLVGDGPLRNELEHFAMPPGITLRFFGNVPYGGLSRFHAQCSLLVFPTLSDTWGLVVNEALASGLPVFGSCYSQAVQELVGDGLNGWTFCPGNEAELDRQLDRALATTGPLLAPMRSAARRSIAHLTPQLGASRFIEAIRLATRR
jgi:glycosyltransferase involved in cell wall biosynthesis